MYTTHSVIQSSNLEFKIYEKSKRKVVFVGLFFLKVIAQAQASKISQTHRICFMIKDLLFSVLSV